MFQIRCPIHNDADGAGVRFIRCVNEKALAIGRDCVVIPKICQTKYTRFEKRFRNTRLERGP